VKNDVKEFYDVKYEHSIHAEAAAILALPEDINYRKVTLVVVRDGMRMSRPCERCEKLIRALGIRKVIYSDKGNLVQL
jgi:deoxycytidylate deaminase